MRANPNPSLGYNPQESRLRIIKNSVNLKKEAEVPPLVCEKRKEAEEEVGWSLFRTGGGEGGVQVGISGRGRHGHGDVQRGVHLGGKERGGEMAGGGGGGAESRISRRGGHADVLVLGRANLKGKGHRGSARTAMKGWGEGSRAVWDSATTTFRDGSTWNQRKGSLGCRQGSRVGQGWVRVGPEVSQWSPD